ncbi:PTS sugar transporter subunit IIA [Tepidibacillus marianensis]|uniref:PTS sugar transporter subunit IIA n=1 Tax=Tepidibacillus marianensis TaxID=3131995 RepID=UPI0030CF1AD7
MKTLIIVTGHGNYATGLQSTIELLAGENPELQFVDFTGNDTDLSLKEKLVHLINEHRDTSILFICDILGGTPFKVAAELANSQDEMEVVAGCNVGSILESFFQKDSLPISELAEFIVDLSKKATGKFQKIVVDEVKINQEVEEGI